MLLSVCMGGIWWAAAAAQGTIPKGIGSTTDLVDLLQCYMYACLPRWFAGFHLQLQDTSSLGVTSKFNGWRFKPGRYASFILYNVHSYTLKERFDEIVQVLMNGPHLIMHSSLTKVSGVARGDSYSSWPASALPLLLFVIRNECSSPSWTICRWWWRWRSSKETNQKWQEFINASTFNITIIIVMVLKIKPKIRWGDNFTWKVE